MKCRLLVQEFFETEPYKTYLLKNFVLFKASIGKKGNNPVWNQFGITAAPALMFLDKNGNEIDWIFGFVPPIKGLFIKIKESLQGIDTVCSLENKIAEAPNDVEALCKLGAKYMNRRITMNKSRDMFIRVLSIDPNGMRGTFSPDWIKGKVTYAEFSEYGLAYLAALKPTQNPKLLIAFLIKYPKSPLGTLAQRALIPFLNN